MAHLHAEWHKAARIGWLRAAVLGANDGVISTASLMVGVAATGATPTAVLTAGVAGLAAGAMSMAAGEYVSVQSQADTEAADLRMERQELDADEEGERAELAAIYVARGLDPGLADQVALQLMAHDALGAHARDELGFSVGLSARPVREALKQNLVAYVPQAEEVDWSFPVSVWDVVLMGRYGYMNFMRMPRAEDRRIAEESLTRVGMLDFRERQIGELSGRHRARRCRSDSSSAPWRM